MKRKLTIAFSLITTSLFFCSAFAVATLGQATPTPAPTLPPGMTGSNTSDPACESLAGALRRG